VVITLSHHTPPKPNPRANPNEAPARHAGGVPTIRGAPPVRRDGRALPGGFA